MKRDLDQLNDSKESDLCPPRLQFAPCKNGITTIVFRVDPKLGETDSFYSQDGIIS